MINTVLFMGENNTTEISQLDIACIKLTKISTRKTIIVADFNNLNPGDLRISIMQFTGIRESRYSRDWGKTCQNLKKLAESGQHWAIEMFNTDGVVDRMAVFLDSSAADEYWKNEIQNIIDEMMF